MSQTHHQHNVQFYETDEFLCEAVSRFMADGLLKGQPVLAIVTADHREQFTDRLKFAGFDIDSARRNGDVAFCDAHQTLDQFMARGVPDASRFHQGVGGMLEQTRAGRANVVVRAYGEMVDVLWKEGNPAGAIMLEDLWNELARKHAFELLCAYAMGNFYSESHRAQLEKICAQHAHVHPAESYTVGADGETRAREILMLQQRANALESEIVQRKKLEDALREAKARAERASRAKSDFTAIMSHELRTPLNSILGYQELLTQEVAGPITPRQRLYLDRIKSGADQLIHLIDQVLSLSRIEAGKERVSMETVDLVALVQETTALVMPTAERKGLHLNLVAYETATRCETDASKVAQILLNLLSNAIKFTNRGTIDVLVRAEDGVASVEVRDTGIGIAPADAARIFEPFEQADASATREHGGSGLGLSVSRNLARLIGGDLSVTSVPGQGSCFSLRLPMVRPEIKITEKV